MLASAHLGTSTHRQASDETNSCCFLMAQLLQFVIRSPDSHALAADWTEVQSGYSLVNPTRRITAGSEDVMIPGENHKH